MPNEHVSDRSQPPLMFDLSLSESAGTDCYIDTVLAFSGAMSTEHIENRNKDWAKVAISYVRFSSRKQRFGKSVERQLDERRAFCQKHKLNLDESRSIMDPGLSAFRGANTAQGGTWTATAVKRVLECAA